MGCPIIPPTEDLVRAMLEASPAPAEQVLGQLPPRNGTVTVEKVAINAVMAGCQPAYFPVVLAAVKAVLQPQFNAGAITTTTGGAAPVVIVSGPIAGRIGIHSGTAVLGSGHRANATIGRALRLTMRNLGGATADTMEKSTHGWPGKYTMCFAENAERNPWEPLHVELGFAPDDQHRGRGGGPGDHHDGGSQSRERPGRPRNPRELDARRRASRAMPTRPGGPHPWWCWGRSTPRRSPPPGSAGRRSKSISFSHARMPLGQLRDRGHWGARSWPEAWEHQPEDFLVPLVTDPEHADPGGRRGRRPAFLLVPRLVGDAAGH